MFVLFLLSYCLVTSLDVRSIIVFYRRAASVNGAEMMSGAEAGAGTGATGLVSRDGHTSHGGSMVTHLGH